MNLTLAILSGIAVFVSGAGLSFLKDFSLTSWMLLFANSSLTIFNQTSKYAAYRNIEASKLQKLNFVPNVW